MSESHFAKHGHKQYDPVNDQKILECYRRLGNWTAVGRVFRINAATVKKAVGRAVKAGHVKPTKDIPRF